MSFSALPAVPQAGIPDWQFQLLNSTKQNVEMLTGQRGNGSASFRAVLRGDITVIGAPEMGAIQVTLSNSGYTISLSGGGTGNVPNYADFISLASTVQQLISDVAQLRSTVNALVSNMRA